MKKIIFIGISILVSVILILTILNLNFEQKQIDEANNSKWVVNCEPGGPDKVVPPILIDNSTHQYNLQICKWIEK